MGNIDSADIKFLKGIGEKRAKVLAKEIGGSSLRDLLSYFPTRHVDRSKFYKISELHGEMPYIQIIGRFIGFREEGEGAKLRLSAAFSDGHGVMQCVWFTKVKVIRDMYQAGKPYVIFGKPNIFNGSYSISHPEVEEYDPAKPMTGVKAIYPMTESFRRAGITQRNLTTAFASLFERREFADLPETLPRELIASMNLMPLREAFYNMHLPADDNSLSRARMRLKFEELFYLELNIVRYARKRSMKLRGNVFSKIGKYFNDFFYNVLPFNLTDAQKRVLKEIRSDMRTGRQMNRLLQGDVGSGKTMVAFMSMLMAIDNGFQACMMAPTEILAAQHYENLTKWCEAIGIKCALLTGNTKIRERRKIHTGLLSGDINIVVGTHALLESKVEFANLGFAVIDEQHRFGVAQRAKMWMKNSIPPHILVMTATPIPRTLAMTVYGDLEVSVIDQLPPGRKPIQTMLCYDENRGEINRLIGRELQLGRQVYIVYPLIHENEKTAYKSAERGYERIIGLFPNYKVGLVHGQLSADRKEEVMQSFISGETQILVSTTVIEVGVNVPNASVMVIEDAERFGLSQLHQLRGRVGRGADKSYCVLVGKQKMSRDTRRRLEVMTSTTDGFILSEADMKMRGPGDMEGTQQSGLAFNLKVASLVTDGQILKVAREKAIEIADTYAEFGAEPKGGTDGCSETIQKGFLSRDSINLLESELKRRFSKKVDWSLIS
ncbi:MAG: ATP-dependent DNA helicase RecG [Muribaculum sp.]|nr:ATP-dependent DNA helicase RecG [Muribaculum sp.]